MPLSKSQTTFAERMMAKMGHIEGKGLGLAADGIAKPLEPFERVDRSGLGYEPPIASLQNLSLLAQPQVGSTSVIISNIPRGSEPAFLYRIFDDLDKHTVKEILITTNRADFAYVIFHTEADAMRAVERYEGSYFGGTQYHKIRVTLISEEDVPNHREGVLRLSTFLRDQEHSIRSSTVLLSNIPEPKLHPQSWINDMFNNIEGCENGEDSDGEEIPVRLQTVILEGGKALIKFGSQGWANWFVNEFNGNYCKTRTIYAKCVPEKEMNDVVQEQLVRREQPKGKNAGERVVHIMIRNVEPGADKSYVIQILHPIKILDVQIPPGNRNFVVVLMTDTNSRDVLKRFPKTFRGRKIFASEMNKGHKKGKKPGAKH